MRVPLFAASFSFVIYVGLAAAQTAQPAQTPPVHSDVPAARSGDAANKPESPTSPGTATPSATGATGVQTLENQVPANSVSAVADSDLQSQIQTALSKEPTLSGDSAHVTVSGDTVELAGTVGTNKEKITATRIVQSYAGSKKLVNRLTIARKGEDSTPRASTPDTSDSKLPSAAGPGNNALPSQGNASSTSRPPLR